jgi:hypothetical protein
MQAFPEQDFVPLDCECPPLLFIQPYVPSEKVFFNFLRGQMPMQSLYSLIQGIESSYPHHLKIEEVLNFSGSYLSISQLIEVTPSEDLQRVT